MNKDDFLDELIDHLSNTDDPDQLKEFLTALLTPTELEEIPKRLQIVKMLKQGIPQREIVKQLRTARATVTRGSHEIRKGKFKDIES